MSISQMQNTSQLLYSQSIIFLEQECPTILEKKHNTTEF